jgi:hypothetical protein
VERPRGQGNHVTLWGMTILDESIIRDLCKELLARPGKPSGRSLRRELLARYQMSGKTQRVFAIWRQELQAALNAQWQRRLDQAESETRSLRQQVTQLISELMSLRAGRAD